MHTRFPRAWRASAGRCLRPSGAALLACCLAALPAAA